jgi:hypothetical protein
VPEEVYGWTQEQIDAYKADRERLRPELNAGGALSAASGDRNWQPVKRVAGDPILTDPDDPTSAPLYYPGKLLWKKHDAAIQLLADVWIDAGGATGPPPVDKPTFGVQNGYFQDPSDAANPTLPVFWVFATHEVCLEQIPNFDPLVDSADYRFVVQINGGCLRRLPYQECP